MCERVFEEGGVTQAAAVATCARVLLPVVRLVEVMALSSRDAHCLRWHLRLGNFAANVVGLLVDLAMVATQGALIGLTLRISVGTLRIGACSCMEHVICLLSSAWGIGMLAGTCTLRTHCVLQKLSGVMVSSNWWGFVCMRACVASTIGCKSCAA